MNKSTEGRHSRRLSPFVDRENGFRVKTPNTHTNKGSRMLCRTPVQIKQNSGVLSITRMFGKEQRTHARTEVSNTYQRSRPQVCNLLCQPKNQARYSREPGMRIMRDEMRIINITIIIMQTDKRFTSTTSSRRGRWLPWREFLNAPVKLFGRWIRERY